MKEAFDNQGEPIGHWGAVTQVELDRRHLLSRLQMNRSQRLAHWTIDGRALTEVEIMTIFECTEDDWAASVVWDEANRVVLRSIRRDALDRIDPDDL